jgi:SAM-dependent methyltransferase
MGLRPIPALLARAKASLAYRVPRAGLWLLALPLRLLPSAARRALALLACYATAQGRDPRRAVRTLLQIDDDLAKCLNQAALRYDGGVHVKHRLMRYHDFFVERIRPGERVLDLGCGYGAVAFSVASRAQAVVTGIDLQPGNIALARTKFRHPNLTFVLGDVLTDLPGGAWETIVFSNVLEHLERRVEFLVSVQQRLAPRRWLIRVPMFDRDWRVPLRQELGLFHFSDPTHFTEYTRETFEREIAAAGLRVVHLQINWGEIWAEVAPPAVPAGPAEARERSCAAR